MEELQSLFQVRHATHDDIYSILSITKEAFTKYEELAGVCGIDALSETYEDVKNDIDNKVVLIAIQDGAPVGSVRVEIDEENKTAYLSRFAVKVTSQNNGIGKSIMNLVDRIMRKRGVKSITLHTGSKITSLIRFYYGRGFYIDSIDKSRGYVRALLKKDYID
ncbi:MAG: GNAT family N-acetyltransferase [Clostridia bacterium]|nr:GNAT family N-acetyltransferase [Clostridia bacterium]